MEDAERGAGGALGLEVRELLDDDAELLLEAGWDQVASQETPYSVAPAP